MKAANKEFNLALDCEKTSFETLIQAVGGASGAAIGTAICGPPCTAAGALVGTWAAKKIGPWADAKWQNLEAWAERTYEGLADRAHNVANDVWDAVTFW